MKNIILTTALALTVAAPAFAQSQLERSVGADADQYTTSQLAILHFAQSETGSDARVYFGDNTGINVSSKGGHNAVATAIFAQMRASESGDER